MLLQKADDRLKQINTIAKTVIAKIEACRVTILPRIQTSQVEATQGGPCARGLQRGASRLTLPPQLILHAPCVSAFPKGWLPMSTLGCSSQSWRKQVL